MSIASDPLLIRDLTVTTPKGRVLLRVPDLTVETGQRIGVRGPSGAGKSTLILTLAGLTEGATGSVIWGDTDLLALAPSARGAFRRSHLGIVFQDFHLFEDLSAADNAGVAALFAPADERTAIRNKARATLSDLHLEDPEQGVSTMSGGERQRVAVARALANAPRMILADEPTANLQRAGAEALAADLCTGQHGLFVATHDEGLLHRMDRILTLQNGEIVDDA